MCGRYTHKLSWKQIVELYRLTLPQEPPEGFVGESYNVAPTNVMPIVRPAGNGRELIMARWGLVPYWSKPEQAAKPSYSTINARDDRIRKAARVPRAVREAALHHPDDRLVRMAEDRCQDQATVPLPGQGPAIRLRRRL